MALFIFLIPSEPARTRDYLLLDNPVKHRIVKKNNNQLLPLKRGASTSPHGSEKKAVASQQPYEVRIGFYDLNNYNINPQVPSFDSNGYVWFIWQEDLQQYMVKNNLTIWEVMTPFNVLNRPTGSTDVYSPPKDSKYIRMADGRYYTAGSYQGTFYIDRIDFRRYPFAEISLPIIIETDEILLNYDKLRIIPDLASSGIGQFMDSNVGWVINGWSIASYRHRYGTDFGFGEVASDFSQVIYEVRYSTDRGLSFWKTILPVFIVMAMVAGVTKLQPANHNAARLSMPVTVLLTLIFLQRGHDSDLPRLPYMTFLDKVYIVSFLLTLISFLLMLWASRRYYSAVDIEDKRLREIELQRLDRFDYTWPTCVVIVGTFFYSISWFTP